MHQQHRIERQMTLRDSKRNEAVIFLKHLCKQPSGSWGLALDVRDRNRSRLNCHGWPLIRN
jgi:hypothetical protein